MLPISITCSTNEELEKIAKDKTKTDYYRSQAIEELMNREEDNNVDTFNFDKVN